MSFREKSIKLRNDNKLSQQELADMLDVSRQTVSRWEAGKNIPSANQISNICNAFHIQANDLIDTESEPTVTTQNENNSEPQTETQPAARKKLNIPILIVIGATMLIALAGLIVTIVYAIKDASYDTSSTVWIAAIPQNTPFVILSVFIAVFIALLAVLLIYLLRSRKK